MLIKGLRPQVALGFPRGEAVTQIGSSEPIWVTDEECGKFAFLTNKDGTYIGLSAETKYQPSLESKCIRLSSSSVSPWRASHLPPGGRQGTSGEILNQQYPFFGAKPFETTRRHPSCIEFLPCFSVWHWLYWP